MAKKEKTEAMETTDSPAQNDTANEKPKSAVVEAAPAGPLLQYAARAFCSCGSKMARRNPKSDEEAENNRWSCEKVWMGQPTPVCQRDIKASKILTKQQAAAADAALRRKQQDVDDE